MSNGLADNENQYIWATRGRTWGFRFLRRGGLNDPLPVYERAFSGISGLTEAWQPGPYGVALRFPDPEGRKDLAGRVIPHDFVLLGRWADQVASLEDGRDLMWSQVANEFQSVWDKSDPPPVFH